MSDHLQVIVKLAERCNLNCAYCYMYSGADQSWRDRPALLSPDDRRRLRDRCAEYLAADPGAKITLEFHGGEPLLLGKAAFAALMDELHDALPDERASYCIQTNGTLLDDEWCALLDAQGVAWSISCDGPPPIHDRYRLYHSGATSSAAVEAAIRRSLATGSSLFTGVLAVIDPATDGAAIVRYFHALGVRRIDLLLPDANHVAKPPHLPQDDPARLAAYLRAAFDAWTQLDDPEFRVRLFEEIIRGLYGLRSGLDAFGGQLWGMSVVESDGSYQLLDVMRLGGLAEVATGLDLARHTFADFLEATRDTFPPPCATCRECPLFRVCGGGYLPHRFNGVDYDRPSVHCEALYDLITHAYTYLRRVTPDALWGEATAET